MSPSVRERRIRRVYRYKSGLQVMTFEDGQDAIMFDPQRLTLWTFDFASEAFRYAEKNKIPMGDTIHVTESLPRGQAAAFSQAAAQSFPTPAQPLTSTQQAAKGSGTAMDSKDGVKDGDFIPIESIALL